MVAVATEEAAAAGPTPNHGGKETGSGADPSSDRHVGGASKEDESNAEDDIDGGYGGMEGDIRSEEFESSDENAGSESACHKTVYMCQQCVWTRCYM